MSSLFRLGVRWVALGYLARLSLYERTIVPKWRVFESHVPLMRYRDRERRRRSERAASRGGTARRILLIETQEDPYTVRDGIALQRRPFRAKNV